MVRHFGRLRGEGLGACLVLSPGVLSPEEAGTAGRSFSLRQVSSVWNIGVPIEDGVWRTEVDAGLAAGVLDPEWFAEDRIEQIYTAEEIASAPLFWLVHMGRTISFPMRGDNIAGITHFTDVDESAACATCGAGAAQSGPLRLPAAELFAGVFPQLRRYRW